jgi:hypothetical protein
MSNCASKCVNLSIFVCCQVTPDSEPDSGAQPDSQARLRYNIYCYNYDHVRGRPQSGAYRFGLDSG